MLGLAGNKYGYCADIEAQFCRGSSGRSLSKHRHCYAQHFEYEHKPVFEEGQRLSTQLLDSLLSNNGILVAAQKERLHAPLGLDDALKQLPYTVTQTSVHRKLTPHLQSRKRHSGKSRVFQKFSTSTEEDTGNFCVRDSELFSLDDVPNYEDDDVMPMFEGDAHPCSPARKHSGKISGQGNGSALGTPRLMAGPKISTLTRVSSESSVDANNKHNDDSGKLSNHGVSYFEHDHLKLVDISKKRTSGCQNCLHTSEEFHMLSGSVSPLNVKIRNDKQTGKRDYIEKWEVENDNGNGIQDDAPCTSHKNGSFPLWQDSFVNDIPSRPLGKAFNPLIFARTYNLLALRVSLAECESLATRLKGHLLNWPRVSNIARVTGDDMDWDNMMFSADRKRGSSQDSQNSLLQAVYGTAAPSGHLMTRVNFAQKLSPRHFQYLEGISRPGHMGVTEKKKKDGPVKTMELNSKKLYMVQLGNSPQSKVQSLDTGTQLLHSSLERWRGPFRLLLLDPKYAGQSELPMAVQMTLNACRGQGKTGPRREIVPCSLTLFYNYWAMEEILTHLLPTGESLPLPIKVLGHVAVIHLGEQYSSVRYLMGKVLLDKHRPRVKTVVNTSEEVECQNLPMLEVLAGNHSLVTSIVENNMRFLVNLAIVHWDSELADERKRLVQRFSKKDIVCDLFAGAGALALLLATKVWRVFANNPVPDASKYLARNLDDNKMQAKVELYNLECCVFIRKLLAFKRPILMTQIVFSLPTNAETVIDALKGAFNRKTWPINQPLPSVYVYGYSNTQHPERDFGHAIVERLGLPVKALELYKVKTLSCGRRLMCASFQLPEALAFDN